MNILLNIIPKNNFVYYLKNKIDQELKLERDQKSKELQIYNLQSQLSKC